MELMNIKKDSQQLEEICKMIREEGRITESQKNKLKELFGSRFENGLQVIKEGKVRKYIFSPSRRKVWVVTGKSQDYQILPRAEFCDCDDYYFRVIDRKTALCYHLIAQKLANALERFELIKKSDEEYDILVKKLRSSSSTNAEGVT